MPKPPPTPGYICWESGLLHHIASKPIVMCLKPLNRSSRMRSTSAARSLSTVRRSDAYPIGNPMPLPAPLAHLIRASFSKISLDTQIPVVLVLTILRKTIWCNSNTTAALKIWCRLSMASLPGCCCWLLAPEGLQCL